MKVITRQRDNVSEPVIILEYLQWSDELNEIEEYIAGKFETITVYGEKKKIVNVRLDKILYFEAVGELVFAYTNDNVYEVKMRLYQVEELVGNRRFYRASKSVLVNINRVESLTPAMNGRFYATMENGEEVLVSRIYAKDVVGYIKTA